jgi:two-component system, NtrC family, nitrogen regulation response regulator GlnG
MKHVSALPVLLVDDDPQVLHSASIVLRTSGVAHVITVEDSRAVMPLLAEQEVGVLVLDLTMPQISGQALLEQVAGDYPDIPVILMTATNDLETAVRCMQTGASDYLVKPVEESRLVSSVKRALEIRTLQAEVLSLKERLLTETPHQREAFAEIITQSQAMFTIFRYLEAIAPSPQPVLITGKPARARSWWRERCIGSRHARESSSPSTWRAWTIRCSRIPCSAIPGARLPAPTRLGTA